MKKHLLQTLLVLSLVCCLAVTASAEVYYGGADWQVAFTAAGRMDSNFGNADLADAIAGMQPGDTTIFTIDLTNQNAAAVDWYMTNEVLYSLEDRSANAATAGGAYTYYLTYTNPAGEETVLFSSDTVGGEGVSQAGEGLHEATSALEDYFYLDTMYSGQHSTIRLEIALDGETQGNDYQDTLADLRMNFAVELESTGSPIRSLLTPGNTTPTLQVVKTGDESDLAPYLIAMGVSGILLLVLAIYSLKKRKTEQGGGT